ncbi:PP2C family protein-serine/threonine phosphatase [Streptomyces sp. NPDC016459]|uniref:PP2C family protein-serine/threonine phosphatase n=1 Tax=Streptomyces sp. NPDC016459 TaxID=3157190 RepID=UPI0033D9131B
MNSDTFHTPAALRRAVRSIALAHRLAADDRARLVLSVSEAAAPSLNAGRHVVLTHAHEPTDSDGCGRLTVTLRLPRGIPAAPVARKRPLLPAEITADHRMLWRVPTPAAPDHGPPTDVDGDHVLVEEELRAALDRTDGLAAEHRKLKHELAETNSGVLALYVQLEERDEELRRAHGRTLRALEDALRPPPLHVDGLEMAVHYAPAGDDDPTGGDLYDWFALPDGTIHITVVDALGHGVTSTRTALTVTHAVRTLALEGHPVGSIVARTDSILAPLDHSVMATLLLTRVNPSTGEVGLANGSHPPALLVRADGTATFLEARGRGVGYPLPGSERIVTATLRPGDLLVLYTDGLTESRRDTYEGESRLLQSARRHRGLPTDRIPAAIARDMLTDVLHKDDTLAIAVRLP